MSANLSAAASATSGAQLGPYRLGAPLWRLRIADAYQATGADGGAATLLVLHADVAAAPGVADALATQLRALSATPEHKHLTRVLGAGEGNGTLWIAIEAADGSNVRDALARKRQNNQGGFGARGAGNLVSAAAGALTRAGIVHGALTAESMVVTRSGGVRLIDLVLGPATVAAVRAGAVEAGGWLAPELAGGESASAATDVYGLGALLYEALVGRPLERGGPRPSEAVTGITSQIDELVARACHREPDRRFGSAQVFGELCAEALARGAVLSDEQTPIPGSQPQLSIRPGDGGAGASVPMTARPGLPSGARGASQPQQPQVSLAESLSRPAAQAAPVDRALAAALADSTEKWLVSKGKLDYGPFSLADVVKQIDRGDIVSGNVIIDKDTGARLDVAKHPLLGALIDASKQKRDDHRRAQAEVAHQGREKRRSALLLGVIGAGVIGLAIGVYFIVQAARGDDKKQVAGIGDLGDATLKVTMSQPKKPTKKPARTGSSSGGHKSNGGASGGPDVTGLGGNADQSMDLSGDDDDEGSATLDMNTVYGVYSRYGGALGGCLQSAGGGTANLSIIIDGKSGKVTWLRVNGENSGALFNCMGRVLKKMSFPSISGPRTRAEFDISI
jgi:hypothetical protein